MKWLYPNFLRKIDHYLKINYPYVWRTRVHDFGWFSLILGNIIAVILGILVVGYDNVFSLKDLWKVNIGFKVLFIFIFLFWVMPLLRFKSKLPDFKALLTTWLMYVLCVMFLGLNVVTFFSSVAYRTAQLYPAKVVQADYDYLKRNFREKDQRYGRKNDPFHQDILLKEHQTEDLLNIMARHGYPYTIMDEIYRYDVNTVYDRLIRLEYAEAYVQQPIFRKTNSNYGEVFLYHRLIEANWVHVVVILFFLPGLWFLLSVFEIRDVLISIFCTVLIFKMLKFFVPPLVSLHGLGWTDPRAFVYGFIAFILAIVLSKKYHLQIWNHIAGVLMLISGIALYMAIEPMSEIFDLYYFLPMTGLLICSLIVWLASARLINKHNVTPSLR